MNEHMTVRDLIAELVQLDPELKIVVPDAPYGQPNPLTRIGIVILREDDKDTCVSAGEYLGLNIGTDLDDDTLQEEPELSESEVLEKTLTKAIEKNPIVAENIEDFILSIETLTKEGKI